ncbi:MAG TPA: DNA methyltransferase [Prosthecobacter sp.]|nr:DNA methyltransferase [Prosthecobacter sp.]
MTVEMWAIDRPTPYARNARKIPQKAIDKVAASIKEFGWRQPIVVDAEGVIVVGHTRLLAARKLGLTEVPVHVAEGLTPAQIKAYRLMDNRSHQESDWDLDLLLPEFLDLKSLEIDLGLTGFDARELDVLLKDPEKDAAADAAPALPEVAVTQAGDLWVCGPHRVLCGDSTSLEAVSRLLGGQKSPFLMVTDPPYGVEYDPEWRNKDLAPADRSIGKVENDDLVDWTSAFGHFPGNVAYVWCASWFLPEVAINLMASGFERRSLIIWSKPAFAISRGHYHWQHEPCWYAVKGAGHWAGDRKQTTLWQIASRGQDVETVHGTQKPVECMRRPMLNNSSIGQAVYEPFMGSGTTLIAAETCQRVCLGLELNPAYVDVAVQRWQHLTGEKAILDGEGADFDTVAAARIAS